MRHPSFQKVGFVLLVLVVVGSVVGIRMGRSQAPQSVPAMPKIATAPRIVVPVRQQSPAGPAAVVSAPPQPTSPAPVTTEICGHGVVPVSMEDHEALTKYNASLVGAKETELIASMQNSSDLRTRAAGLLLDGREYGDNLISSASERSRSDLVQLAVGSTDQAVYGLAVQMCGAYKTVKGMDVCRPISANRWAQIDPNNAAPWFVIAEQARAQHDEATEATAFERGSHATEWRQYTDEFVAFADAMLPKDLPEYDKLVLQMDVATYGTWLSDYPWGIIVNRCSAAALQDTDRVSTCSSIASLLIDKGRTFMGFGIGVRIGERVGWPASRLDPLRDEFAAMHSKERAAGMQSLSCESLMRLEPTMRGAMQGGEMGFIRAVLQASGISVTELAKHTDTPVEILLDQIEGAADSANHPPRPANP